MLRKPAVPVDSIGAWIAENYGLKISTVEPLNLGYDPAASVYKLETRNQPYFLKIHSTEINPTSLTIPHLLQKNGIKNIIAPLETKTSQLWSPIGEFSAVLYPFVTGDSAMEVGLTSEQWLEFGRTLKQIHSPEIAQQVTQQVPHETFGIPSLEKVFEVEKALKKHCLEHPAQQKLSQFWAEKRELIHHIGSRARHLGQKLQTQSLELVLCHSDIHAANMMVSSQRIYLVDWDTPILAPPERDLLFVIGSVTARKVLPEEEAWFFEGYGKMEINLEALAYFRYERAIQDIGEFGYSILFDTGRSDEDILLDLKMFIGQFAPGDVLDLAMAIDPEA